MDGVLYALMFVGGFCLILLSVDWILTGVLKAFPGIEKWIIREFMK